MGRRQFRLARRQHALLPHDETLQRPIGYPLRAHRLQQRQKRHRLLPDRPPYEARPADPARNLGTEAEAELETFFSGIGADIRHSDEPRAYYLPAGDYIHMPPVATFHSAAGYYATLAHETTHWTGHKSRLDRFGRFNDRKAYAFEELIAEIGNCMVCASLGLTPDFDQSAAYLKSWLRALADDKRLIFKAASEAQKAADWLLKAAATHEADSPGNRAAA